MVLKSEEICCFTDHPYKLKNRVKQVFLLFIFCTISCLGFSQTVEKIKFKKDRSLIYFFQKGTRSDTLHKDKEHLFYLVLPDSLKKDLSIEVENAQLMSTPNDSLLKLNYLPGFKYESFFVTSESVPEKSSGKAKYEFKTMVDGISILAPYQITISLINKKTGGLVLENKFTFSN